MSTIIMGLRWMFRGDAPLLMNPNPSWHKYSWMGEFVRNNRSNQERANSTVRDVPKIRIQSFVWPVRSLRLEGLTMKIF
jgi:hypothetical protein